VTQQPFADRPLWSVAPDGKAVALIEAQPGAGSSLLGISATGEIRFRTALPLPRLPVSDALYITTIDSLVGAWSAARPGGAKAVDRAAVVKAIKRPRDLGPVAQILAGSDGRIWLRLRSQAPAGFAEWRSYTATGTPSSAILLPSNMRFMLFTGTAAWGAGEDSDGEPTVVEYVLP